MMNNKMGCVGLIASGMLMGMGVFYAIECKNKKSIEELVEDAKCAISDC